MTLPVFPRDQGPFQVARGCAGPTYEGNRFLKRCTHQNNWRRILRGAALLARSRGDDSYGATPSTQVANDGTTRAASRVCVVSSGRAASGTAAERGRYDGPRRRRIP